MLRLRLTRLFSVSLIVLIGGGGGGLPVLDGLIFHNRDRAADATQSHLEALSGCHADGCALRSTAHQARLAPALGQSAVRLAEPESALPPRALRAPMLRPQAGQPLSRAPPRFG